MKINNLSQLKKAMKAGHDFIVKQHYHFPEYTGQTRTVKECGTTYMYTGIKNNPLHRISQMNDGKGCYLNFGKAADWKFDDGLCTMYNRSDDPILTIEVI